MQTDSMLVERGMRRIDENIHATYPPYATLALILHKSLHEFVRADRECGGANMTDCGTTLSNGAADANGR